MKRQLRISAAFVAASVLFNLSGTIQSATAADEAKGFRGYVCNDSGKPVPNAKVAVNYYPVETDSQGRFFLPHEKLKYERTAFVTVEATFENKERPLMHPWEVNYAAIFNYVTGEENVTIQPGIPSALGGRVLSTAGKPIAGATVSAYIGIGMLSSRGIGRVREPVQTDPEGRFLIPKLYAYHDYLLRVEVVGYERKWTGWIYVRSGEPKPVEDIRLREAPAFVAGKVVDAQGNPVAKAQVWLGHFKDPDAITETDAQGNFRIDSLFTDQEVELQVGGTAVKVKTKAGTSDLRIVARPKL